MTTVHAEAHSAPQRRAGDALGEAAGRSLCVEYCEAVDAAVALLESTRARLRDIAGGGSMSPFSEAFRTLVDTLWSDWRTVWRDAFASLSELAQSQERMAAAKQYTEAHLTHDLLSAPIWRQAYAKPRGYCGDYVVMSHIYDGRPMGDTTFARLAQALAVRIGEFVLRRKDLVRAAIEGTVERRSAMGEATIVSLGCGPAREIVEFAASDRGRDAATTFILVDHDEEALRFAESAIPRACAAPLGRWRLRVDTRKLSALRLLRDLRPIDAFGSVDLIYSAGLFDYFSDRTCRLLTRRLYEALQPGGSLLLGNMKAGTDMLWPLYLIADWPLQYRSAEGVMSWTEGLPGAEVSLRTESTGYDYLLTVRKPA
jgi:extracellular factor (EF) 3-hydroxypalmitic acid methyl ester biosynthesis protein